MTGRQLPVVPWAVRPKTPEALQDQATSPMMNHLGKAKTLNPVAQHPGVAEAPINISECAELIAMRARIPSGPTTGLTLISAELFGCFVPIAWAR